MATSRLELPDPERALLYARSGNECAFPGCTTVLVERGAGTGAAVNIGKAAHIIASSRQGPRGDSPLTQVELDKSAANRILLCPDHHDRIDQEPIVYTVEVLRQMKADHEGKHRAPSAAADPPSERRTDRLLSSLLPVVGLPVVVESASLRDPTLSERDIARALQYPRGSRGIVFPFISRDGRLWTFSHLRRRQHPFAPVIDSDVEAIELIDLASTGDEGHRRVIALLNRALGRHLGMRDVRFDREHQRYWCAAKRDAEGNSLERQYRYRTKAGRTRNRPVVHHSRRRSGEAKDEWVHEAARLRFERFADSWFLTVRPEFHLTLDGAEPLPAHRIGRKVTRKKSHLYNEQYLDRLWFWKDFLADGGPRLTIKTGEQSVLVEAAFEPTEVVWPGVPKDAVAVSSDLLQETLFSIADLEDDGDDEWWDDEDEAVS